MYYKFDEFHEAITKICCNVPNKFNVLHTISSIAKYEVSDFIYNEWYIDCSNGYISDCIFVLMQTLTEELCTVNDIVAVINVLKFTLNIDFNNMDSQIFGLIRGSNFHHSIKKKRRLNLLSSKRLVRLLIFICNMFD